MSTVAQESDNLLTTNESEPKLEGIDHGLVYCVMGGRGKESRGGGGN